MSVGYVVEEPRIRVTSGIGDGYDGHTGGREYGALIGDGEVAKNFSMGAVVMGGEIGEPAIIEPEGYYIERSRACSL